MVAARPDVRPSPGARILCPGPTTTATLLYRSLHPGEGEIDHAVFSDIGPALRRGDADLGVLIHEGRLTYRRDGLHLIEDLGDSFERLARAPLPLGGILARLTLPDGVAERFTAVLRDSIAYAWANREEVLVTIRRYAQELDEDVIWPYVKLYVNDHTIDLGDDGIGHSKRSSGRPERRALCRRAPRSSRFWVAKSHPRSRAPVLRPETSV